VSSSLPSRTNISSLFAYGTLLPGEERWHMLAPFVVDEGFADTVQGEVYDTGLGYPAARFDRAGVIHGRTFHLLASSLVDALRVLDEVEGVVDGEYRRIVVTTTAGYQAWSYECGAIEGMHLTALANGDWVSRHRSSDRVSTERE
jgi:gamma-glutamylcyclotransferase (GGCT)/AIG2-like uncharacterized protein YtfP